MSNLPDGGTEDDMAIKVRTAQQAVRPEADLSAPAQTAWAAWEKRDRPIRERVALRAATRQDRWAFPTPQNSGKRGSDASAPCAAHL